MVAVEKTDRELLHKDKYPSLISYHGKYFYRSGSTVRTITGKGLDKAIVFLRAANISASGITVLCKAMDIRRIIG